MTQSRRLRALYGAVPALDCNLEEKKFTSIGIAICDSEFNREEKTQEDPAKMCVLRRNLRQYPLPGNSQGGTEADEG